MTIDKGKTKIIMTSTISILVAIALVPMLTEDAFAKHQGANQHMEFEKHTWSRASNDNHSSYLNCGTGTNSDKCAVKIKIFSDVKKTGVSKTDVTSEVVKIEARFDGMNKNMSFDKVLRADSYISSKRLDGKNTGFTEYTLHCTDKFLWHCVTYDKHFVKMELFINSNSNLNWNTSEICDRNQQPTQRDIEKTLGHELLHVIGVDHNSRSSDVRGTPYTCGSANGYDLSTADKTKVGALYP